MWASSETSNTKEGKGLDCRMVEEKHRIEDELRDKKDILSFLIITQIENMRENCIEYYDEGHATTEQVLVFDKILERLKLLNDSKGGEVPNSVGITSEKGSGQRSLKTPTIDQPKGTIRRLPDGTPKPQGGGRVNKGTNEDEWVCSTFHSPIIWLWPWETAYD
jgi:hypothetical protein